MSLAKPHAWDLVSEGYDEEIFEQFTGYAADALALARVKAQERVLDVAAGPGPLALCGAAIGAEVHALDFSRAMLDRLALRAERARLTVHLDQGDGQALPYADRSFDAAFSLFGVIFFPDRAAGLAELHRVLKPGGRAVVSSWQPMSRAPLVSALFSALAEELPRLAVGDGKGPYSDPDELAAAMRAAGFVDVEVVPSVHALEAPSVAEFFARMRRSNARLALLEEELGPAFAPLAEGAVRRMSAHLSGPVAASMPAWLALGARA